MSDQIAFIKNILALPEDRLRWLVYADWLAERNDPREGWCRATAAWMEATLAGDAKEVKLRWAEREVARMGLNPQWLAVLDEAEAFTVMLPAAYITQLQRIITSGILDTLESWGTVQSDFRMAKLPPKAHLYAIRLHKGDVRVVGRLRVKTVKQRTRAFAPGEFANSGSWGGLRPDDIQIVTGTEGTFIPDGCLLPRVVLERFRYVQRSKERGLSSLRDGKLTNATTIQGVFRLTPQSRLDLAWLLFRDGEPAPLLTPGK